MFRPSLLPAGQLDHVIVRLADRGVRLVLLDIEGTTTPIAFVHEVLFPFARRRVAAWFRERSHSPDAVDLARDLAADCQDDLRRGEAVPADARNPTGESTSAILAYVSWLMDLDRKSPALKRLQGLIWEQGYQAGELCGQVYPDVPAALLRWRVAGVGAAIYSSGSELAQRRLFASTEHGDLSPLITAFFDTGVGPKRDSASYDRIASILALVPGDILFVSDVTAELAAARKAGYSTALSIRPGNHRQPDAADYTSIETFDEIV